MIITRKNKRDFLISHPYKMLLISLFLSFIGSKKTYGTELSFNDTYYSSDDNTSFLLKKNKRKYPKNKDNTTGNIKYFYGVIKDDKGCFIYDCTLTPIEKSSSKKIECKNVYHANKGRFTIKGVKNEYFKILLSDKTL